VISNLMYKLFGSPFTSTCTTFAVTFNAFEEQTATTTIKTTQRNRDQKQ